MENTKCRYLLKFKANH